MYGSDMRSLMNTFHSDGQVASITVRPHSVGDVKSLQEVLAIHGQGLEGDHHKSKDGKRQVTLIQGEHLDAVASILKLEKVNPTLTRRNIVVCGINLISLKGKQFQVGEAILEYTGECHPCSRMETNLGRGGYNAMRGHGGITARIIKGGKIAVGDTVSALTAQPTATD